MAANKISTFNIPNDGEAIDIPDYIPYDMEGEYVDPTKVVTKETQKRIDRIKARKIGIGVSDIFKEAKTA